MKGKSVFLTPFAGVLLLISIISCTGNLGPVKGDENQPEGPGQDAGEQFSVSAPEVDGQIDKMVLSDASRAIAGNAASFAFNLLKANAGTVPQNRLYSPLSLQMALGMLAEGVSPASAAEIASVLGGFSNLASYSEYCKSLVEQLPAVDTSTVVRNADAFIVNDRFTLRKSYRDAIAQYYYSPVESISFDDAEYVRSLVNSWCSRNTEGLIPSLLDNVTPDAAGYLLNALYFRARWQEQFDARYQILKDQEFNAADAVVKMDFLTERDNMMYVDKGDFRAVRKLYGNGSYAFYAILPESADIKSTLGLLASGWNDVRQSMTTTDVALQMPKFRMECNEDMIETFQSLGVKDVFDNPDFTGMFEDPYDFCVSGIRHKTFLSVDENGTEGAAATIVEVIATEAGPDARHNEPVQFCADRPFIFVVSEETSGAILFSGIMAGK